MDAAAHRVSRRTTRRPSRGGRRTAGDDRGRRRSSSSRGDAPRRQPAALAPEPGAGDRTARCRTRRPLEPVVTVPPLLNGFTMWNWLLARADGDLVGVSDRAVLLHARPQGAAVGTLMRRAAVVILVGAAAAIARGAGAVRGPSSQVAWTLETVRSRARRATPANGKKLNGTARSCHGDAGDHGHPRRPDSRRPGPALHSTSSSRTTSRARGRARSWARRWRLSRTRTWRTWPSSTRRRSPSAPTAPQQAVERRGDSRLATVGDGVAPDPGVRLLPRRRAAPETPASTECRPAGPEARGHHDRADALPHGRARQRRLPRHARPSRRPSPTPRSPRSPRTTPAPSRSRNLRPKSPERSPIPSTRGLKTDCLNL